MLKLFRNEAVGFIDWLDELLWLVPKHGINNLDTTDVKQPKKTKRKADDVGPEQLRLVRSLDVKGSPLHRPIENARACGYTNLRGPQPAKVPSALLMTTRNVRPRCGGILSGDRRFI